jgi:hypothetical protein
MQSHALRPKLASGVAVWETIDLLEDLTKLYNKRPAWLENTHQTLDRAVFDAYGLAYPLSKDEIIRHLLELNRERAAGHVRVLGADLPPKTSPGVEGPPRQKPSVNRRTG